MYVYLKDIKPNRSFRDQNKDYKVLEEKSSNQLLVRVYNYSELKSESLPRYTKIPVNSVEEGDNLIN